MNKPGSPALADIPTFPDACRHLLRVWRLMRPYWGGVRNGVLLGMVLAIVALVPPYFSKLLFDQVYPARDVRLLEVVVIAGLGFALGSSLLGGLRGYFMQILTGRLNRAAGLMFFNHLQHLPIRFFEQRRIGEVLSRNSDVRASLETVARVIDVLVMNGILLLLLSPILLIINPTLALVSVITMPVTSLISLGASRIMRRYSKQSIEASADLSAFQTEAFVNIRTLKTMGEEHFLFSALRDRYENVFDIQTRSAATGGLISLLNTTIRTVGSSLFLWFAWRQIIDGRLSLGGLMVFSSYIGYVKGPIDAITGLFISFQQSAVNLGRMFEYLDQTPEQDPTAAYQPLAERPPLPSGHVELRDVDFAYAEDKPVLRSINLLIRQHQVTAVVGQSGAGKSSLLRLIARLELPNRGALFIGGQPVARTHLSLYRSQVGVVWQDVSLLKGTVRENLTMRRPGISQERLDHVIEVCQLSDWLARFPDGYDAQVAEWGASMSGGQKQRLALARALVPDPAILLLDEFTSNLDLATEASILRSLFSDVARRTVVLVTHRVSAAQLADSVIMMHEGRIIASGTHDELLRESQAYFSLFATERASSVVGPRFESRREMAAMVAQ